MAGLAAGYLVHRRETLVREYQEDLSDPDEPATVEEDLNTAARGDASALAGFGLALPVGDEARLLLEVRYEHGLLDVDRRIASDFRSRSLTLLAGLAF